MKSRAPSRSTAARKSREPVVAPELRSDMPQILARAGVPESETPFLDQAEQAGPAVAESSAPQNGDMPDRESGDEGTEQEVEGELFVQGEGDEHAIDINDIDQGALGDCYFLAVLASIARVRPDFIRDMIDDHGDGTYTVTFHTEQGFSGLFGYRNPQSVTVDSRFWVDDSGRPIYAGTGDTGADGPELWVMVIEKAWAKLHGGYGEIRGGAIGDDAREAVTGMDAEYVDPSDLTADELLARFDTHFNTNHLPVIAWSHGDEKSKKLSENGVVTNHEYAMDGCDEGAGTVDLYNPHGHGALTGVDMAFVRANFQRIRFLNLPPADE